MKNNSKNIFVTLVAIGVGIALIFVFFLGRLQRQAHMAPIAKITKIEGKIDLKPKKTGTWLSSAMQEDLFEGDQIKIGETSTATLSWDDQSAQLGPRTHVLFKTIAKATVLELISGELQITSNMKLATVQIHKMNRFLVTPSSSLVISTGHDNPNDKNIFGQVLFGEALFEDGRSQQKINKESGTFLLGSQQGARLWSVSPHMEQSIPNKEGFAAVTFHWSQTDKASNSVHLNIRNLDDGEFTSHEQAASGMTLTLKQGSYLWSVHDQGTSTPPRRFYITGAPQSNSNTPVAPSHSPESPIEDSSEASEGEKTSTITDIDSTPKATSEGTSQESASHAQSNVTATASSSQLAVDPAKFTILAPKNGAKIPVAKISEQRVIWQVEPKPEKIELEIIGSSLNPTLRHQILGTRSRQKLTELPPGTYSIRIRGLQNLLGQQTFTPWKESMFEVVQTQAGQLAPSQVEAEIISKNRTKKLSIQWMRSSAPLYQVIITNSANAASVRSTTENKMIVPIANKPPYKISVCAMDANRLIRGCAEDIIVGQ